jgi:hypothetical protein
LLGLISYLVYLRLSVKSIIIIFGVHTVHYISFSFPLCLHLSDLRFLGFEFPNDRERMLFLQVEILLVQKNFHFTAYI